MNNQKKIGIWMDAHHATIAVNEEGSKLFTVLAHVKGSFGSHNSNEKNAHNHEKTLQGQFFKEITTHMQNAEIVHVTGTGDTQEQFMHYLAETPQFKNTKTSESTSNKMSEEKLMEYFEKR
jgi:stalled ribosome rescue protein Dom34